MKRALVPKGAEPAIARMQTSPGILCGRFVFVTGMTGSSTDGSMPEPLEAQFRNAFVKIGHVLQEAGLGFEAVVEMTSYHIGLGDHFDLFTRVRAEFVTEPFPAWTAVEVAGLRRPGAVVEIRVIAACPAAG